MPDNDVTKLATFCRANLDLAHAKLSDEYYYLSLPLCVIDAVFSIGVRYTSTRNTVIRFCDSCGLRRIRPGAVLPATVEQLSITEFVRLYDRYGVDRMTEHVYQNHQRTSTRNGILKSEAALMFGQTLQRFRVEYLQDVATIVENPHFESEIQWIPGQTSGIALRYFYMLAGSDDHIKPDRMIARFIESALHKSLSVEESHRVVVGACEVLKKEYPHLTPRLLDHQIWNYQRDA